MTFKKSPFPYIVLLLVILTLASYMQVTIDKTIEEPIVYTITKKESKATQLTKKSKTTLSSFALLKK